MASSLEPPTALPLARQLLAPGLLLVLATAVISGCSNFANIYAVQGTSSEVFVTLRNCVVALLVVPLTLVVGRGGFRALSRRDWAWLVLIGLVGGSVPFLLYFQGLKLASAAGGATTASFVYRTLFVVATVLGVLVLKERFHAKAVVGGALLLAGNFLLLALTSPIWTDGTVYVFAATGLWAVEYTMSKRALRTLPSGVVASGRMGFGALFLLGYLVATSQAGSLLAYSGGQWAWVAVSALLLTAFVGTWYAGLKRVDLGVATSVLVLGYPITWALSVVVTGSKFTDATLVGAALVALGVGVVVGASLWRETLRWTLARMNGLARPTV